MKLLVMDVEGTLFKATMKIDGTDYPSTMWQPIAYALGEAAMEEERETHKKWDNLEYDNYMEWVKATIDIHRKYSLKKEVFDRLIKKAEYSEGVEEFFRQLNRNEWIPVLISGGFQNLIRRAQNELDIDYGFGACEYYFDDYGYLEHYNLQPSDFDGKLKFLDNLLREYKLNRKTDWVFIGDGKNDEAIARQAPRAFGINPHKKLREIEGLIEVTSFLDMIPYLQEMENLSPKTVKESAGIHKSYQKPENDVAMLHQRIFELKSEVRRLKQKQNSQKVKVESKIKLEAIRVSEIDYEKTPRQSLQELMKGLRVIFLGLDENCTAFQRLSRFSDLRVISGIDNNFSADALQSIDFLFIYKNHAAHSAIWHALANNSTIPFCYLSEHTNDDLLENAMANVLYRFIYK